MRFQDKWNENETKLYDKVKMISHARQKYSSMALGDLSIIYNLDSVLIIKKKYFNEETIFILNLSDENKFLGMLPEKEVARNSMLDRSVLVVENEKINLDLGPYETKAFLFASLKFYLLQYSFIRWMH